MFFTRNLKITHRLFAIVAMVLIGFAALGISYLQLNIANARFEATSAKLNKFESEVDSSHISLKIAQLIEKDFAFTRNVKLLDKFESAMTDSRESMATITNNLPQGMEAKNVNLLTDLFANYHSDFYAMAEAIAAIGFNENSGSQGALRDAAHSIEDEIKTVSNDKLDALLLSLRRHEKDFILRRQEKYVEKLNNTVKLFLNSINNSKLSSVTINKLETLLNEYKESFLKYVEGVRNLERATTTIDSRVNQIEPVIDKMLTEMDNILKLSTDEISIERTFSTTLFAALLLGIGLIVALIVMLFARGLTASLNILQNTVRRLTAGELDARCLMTTGDELGTLGRAFDNLLDERVSTMAKAENENERLNDSIIDLLEAVSVLSERDLTIMIPVAEDITGPVADAMNMMASETARVLKDIREISEKVEQAANSISSQGQRVSDVAAKEREIVQATMVKLEESSTTMNDIAKQAQSCNDIANMASNSTAEALTSVNNTAEGMNDIRETISETEKRIKRLGERSQEITGVVQIINTIAERTHVLSLNASMQAASAGEAGRGFAVVADEVQRLAESSRQSTAEIQALVTNIQAETAETMVTMNRTITQVIDGTELAQRSGEQMKLTQKTTFDLASAVEKIAERSLLQAGMSDSLRQQATEIVNSTEETSKELEEQSKHTQSMVEFAKRLLESVRVFKLPV